MPFHQVWETLGIEATADAGAVRRAYARKLKVTQPEDDPAGFQRLRAAYEQAQLYCQHHELMTAAQALTEESRADAETRDPAPGDSGPSDSGPIDSGPILNAPIVGAPSDGATADPAPPPREPEDPATVALDAAFTALEDALRDTPTFTPELAEKRLHELLSSPSLERLDLLQRAEQRLAERLLASTPRSDALLERVITHFGWEGGATGGFRPPAANAVLQRRGLARLEDHLEHGVAPDALAYQRLAKPRRPLQRHWDAYATFQDPFPEIAVIERLEREHPDLLERLDADNVRWWRRVPGRPHVSLLGVAVLVILTVLGGLSIHAYAARVGSTSSAIAHLAAALGGLAAALAFRVYALDWPAILVARRWRYRPPLEFLGGWLPAGAALMLGAQAAHHLPLVAWPLAGMSIAVAWWALIADGPSRAMLLDGEFKLRNSRLVRIVSGNLIAGIWLHLCSRLEATALDAPVLVTVIAALCASASSRQSALDAGGRLLSESDRRDVLIALLVASGATVCALFAYGDDDTARPMLLVAVLALTVLRRGLKFLPPSLSVPKLPPLTFGILAIALVRGFGAITGGWGAEGVGALDWLVVGGVVMLGGVVATTIGTFRQLPR